MLLPFGKRDVDVTYRGRGAHFQQFTIPNANPNRLAGIEAAGVDLDFLTGKQPAHGQRFQRSLGKPLLLVLNRDRVVIAKV